MAGLTKTTTVIAARGEAAETRTDQLAAEEPLEIRAQTGSEPALQIAVTMRTPGHDAELAVGFFFTEGLVRERGDLARPPVRELEVEGAPGNVATARLTRPFDAERLRRSFYATSSCGICGKAAIDHLDTGAGRVASPARVRRSVLLGLPAMLRAQQAAFERTGGLHATGAFDTSGELLVAREDVGRHNAMDKVVGRLFLDGRLPFSGGLLLVSGRASFELVQKAAMAGVPILAAVSAPSSLAVEAADRLGITLVGFLRADGLNVYTHAERVDLSL